MKSILLIDDDPQVLQTLKRVLSSHGDAWELETAADGTEAILLVRQKTFDMIITDIFMPKKDGLETIGEIRRVQPLAKILAITGGSIFYGTEVLNVAQLLGAHEVLEKPIGIDKLLAMVRGLLGEDQGSLSATGNHQDATPQGRRPQPGP